MTIKKIAQNEVHLILPSEWIGEESDLISGKANLEVMKLINIENGLCV